MRILDPIVNLLEKILDSQERIEEKLDVILSDQEDLTPFPSIPKIPTVPDFLGGPNTCGKCGVALTGVMGYWCSRPDCPTCLGPTIC